MQRLFRSCRPSVVPTDMVILQGRCPTVITRPTVDAQVVGVGSAKHEAPKVVERNPINGTGSRIPGTLIRDYVPSAPGLRASPFQLLQVL